ncbi:hypothetical protein BIY26_18805 [Brenneria goodwinii]|uniref:Uncharacterized protein n=1 Tax=Brenneria goodwinii TaxID=1109412 RepID=A0AAE8JLH9_9GAMM|nr:hypothetical protein [Brenneria goodwinii]ATA25128.1 hypothetical protein AWC36_13900 [Brenneria goodwinii]MCG8155373.1 hypothetical protein [Brenneria goodwinii]MCG8161573.1 hypothetical protein [Brenneria goodwinii]MCG8166080.1 hypothetical protein [Brenneria goodwinii]MCG8169220.1 hypothetical protein [Brenneria goodwinii]
MDLLKFLLRLPFTLIKGLFRALGLVLGLFGRVIKPIVGHIDWRPIDNGQYRIRAVDDRGRADSRLIRIEIVN